MFRKTMLASLLLVGSCTDHSERTAYLSFPGDADSLSGSVEEAPTLVLRCLNGRVDAYLAMDPSAEPVADQVFPVQLDSAPECE